MVVKGYKQTGQDQTRALWSSKVISRQVKIRHGRYGRQRLRVVNGYEQTRLGSDKGVMVVNGYKQTGLG